MTPNTLDGIAPKSDDALAHEAEHRPRRATPNNLRDQIAGNWPTASATDYKGSSTATKCDGSGDPGEHGEGGDNLRTAVAGCLSAAWVETLMGFPPGWTADGDVPHELPEEWPSRPGEPQHAWEPPRTVAHEDKRAKRLRALGNAVVPAVAYVAGSIVREIYQ